MEPTMERQRSRRPARGVSQLWICGYFAQMKTKSPANMPGSDQKEPLRLN
jgi:hypothetical protein